MSITTFQGTAFHTLVSRAHRHQQSAFLKQTLRTVQPYTAWDVWKTHPLCFLTVEEVHLVQQLLTLGSVTATAKASRCPRYYIEKRLNHALHKLTAGHADYLRVAALARERLPATSEQLEAVLLQRPFVLWNYPRQLLNVLASHPDNWSCFEDAMMGGTLKLALEHLYGFGPYYHALLRMSFEKQGVESLYPLMIGACGF